MDYTGCNCGDAAESAEGGEAGFDLKEQVAHWTLDPEHPEENVGIRMILGMAKDVSYANTMRANYLRIRV